MSLVKRISRRSKQRHALAGRPLTPRARLNRMLGVLGRVLDSSASIPFTRFDSGLPGQPNLQNIPIRREERRGGFTPRTQVTILDEPAYYFDPMLALTKEEFARLISPDDSTIYGRPEV